jgi:predicted nucleic acid-binding protein
VSVYFDTAYVAKCYLNEADSGRVRALVRRVGGAVSASLCLPELAAVLLCHEREKRIDRRHSMKLRNDFARDVEAGVFTLLSISDGFLDRVAARVAGLPAHVHVRAADAIHLCAASEGGFAEVWTNDRHMLAAAPAFGLLGQSV